MTTARTIEDVLAIVRLPEERAEICLRADLLLTYWEKATTLAALVDDEGAVTSEEDGAAERAQALADELASIASEMREAMWRPLFRGMTAETLEAFQKKHDVKKDAAGYFDELIVATMVEPIVTVEEVRALRKSLPAGLFPKLIDAAQGVVLQTGGPERLPSLPALRPTE